MMGSNMKVLIVGAGFMGEVHAKAYRNLNNVEIFGVVDKNAVKASEFSDKFDCRCYYALKDALSTEVDFVDICLPTSFHKDTILDCFIAGKDVICEKPIAFSFEEAMQITEASEKFDRKLMIAHVVRFWPEYMKLASMIQNGEIKGVKTLTLTRYGAPPKWSEGGWMLSDSKSGGVIYDLTIHDIDYAISLFGTPLWVFARRSRVREDYTAYVNAILGYEEVNVLIESGFIMANSYPFTTGFRLNTGEETFEYINKNNKGLVMYSNSCPDEKGLNYDDFDPYKKELEYFIECINENRKPVLGSAIDAATAVKIGKCIEISAANNYKVEVV